MYILINTQFILDFSRSVLKQIINLNKKLLESNVEQERVKENLSVDAAEKILKSVFWKKHSFKWKTTLKNSFFFFEQESAIY